MLAAAAVTIFALLANNSAHLTICFGAEGEEVRVTVRGGEGLKVRGEETPLKGRLVARGERLALDVDFEPGPARSTLTVEVTGKFQGEQKSFSQAFRVGRPDDEQRRKDRERIAPPPR